MIVLTTIEQLANSPVMILPPEFQHSEPVCGRHVAFRPKPEQSGNLQGDPEIHRPSTGMDVDIAALRLSGELPARSGVDALPSTWSCESPGAVQRSASSTIRSS